MKRAFELEILDSSNVPEHLVDQAYRDLTRLHRVLGDTGAVIRAIRRDPLPVRRVLDIGCARGGVSADVQRALGVEVVGIDLVPSGAANPHLRIVWANAARDALPEADIAYCMHVAHHLSEADLIAIIRNVGYSCRRLILLDLVRHRMPLTMFRLFVAPLFSHIAAMDGALSVRRSYTPREFGDLVRRALTGSGATFHHSVSPFWIRQTVDISWPH